MLGGSKALKARPVKAMGATHGHDNRIRSGFWPNLAQSRNCRFAKTVEDCFFNRKGHEGETKGTKRKEPELRHPYNKELRRLIYRWQA
jgi:hypothetical protein